MALFFILNKIMPRFIRKLVSTLFKLAPWTILLTWVIFPKVWQKSKIFFSNQNKATVYGILVKNNSQIVMLYVLLFAIGTMIEKIF